MSEAAAVLAVADRLRFVRESPRNSNGGAFVASMLALCGLPAGHPWCAAYVAWVGIAALGERWPVPRTASCLRLGEWAAKAGVLAPVSEAEPGDLFLLYYPTLKRFAHVGFITGPKAAGAWPTLEGNTNDGGSRDGWGVFARTRTFGPRDRVVKWRGAL